MPPKRTPLDGRPSRRAALDRQIPLSHGRVTSLADQRRSSLAIKLFEQWLAAVSPLISWHTLAESPIILNRVIMNYAEYLYASGSHMYQLIGLVTGLQHAVPDIRGHLKGAWSLISVWGAREPTVHRTPLPFAVLKAIAVLALQWGWKRWLAVTFIAFFGPARIGEPIRALRRELVLPSDVLEPEISRAHLHIVNPKSAFRGGAAQQHTTISCREVVQFLQAVYGNTAPGERLFSLCSSSYRRRWDLLVKHLGLPRQLFTPGGLRGGGAVYLYLRDTPIVNIQWAMRVRQLDTLQHYIQKVAAIRSLAELPSETRALIASLGQLYSWSLDKVISGSG